jgi:hypothetical protein
MGSTILLALLPCGALAVLNQLIGAVETLAYASPIESGQFRWHAPRRAGSA